jgi:hypothetical protein
MAADDVAAALMWQPQASGSVCDGCLYTDTRVAKGGVATVGGTTFASLRDPLANQTWTDHDLTTRGAILVLTGSNGVKVTVNGTTNAVMVSGGSGLLWFVLGGLLILLGAISSVAILVVPVNRKRRAARGAAGGI